MYTSWKTVVLLFLFHVLDCIAIFANQDLLPTLRPGNFDLHTKMPGSAPAWTVVHKCPLCADLLLVGRRSERLCRRLVVINISVRFAMFSESCRKTSISFADIFWITARTSELVHKVASRKIRNTVLFETKYDIFLVSYITMKLIGCLRQRWIFLSKVRMRFSPWLPRYGRQIQILGRISSSFWLLLLCGVWVCFLNKRLITAFLTRVGKPFQAMKVYILPSCWSKSFGVLHILKARWNRDLIHAVLRTNSSKLEKWVYTDRCAYFFYRRLSNHRAFKICSTPKLFDQQVGKIKTFMA